MSRRHRVTVRYADGTTKVVSPGHFRKRKPQRKPRRRRKGYYLSKGWRARRFAALQRDGFKCRACGAPEWRAGPLHVHHLTYERFGNERLDDLTTLCEPCHVALHRRRKVT